MSATVKTISIELSNGTLIQMKGSLSIAKTIKILGSFDSSEYEEVISNPKRLVPSKKRVPPLELVESSETESDDEFVEDCAVTSKRVQRNNISKEEEKTPPVEQTGDETLSMVESLHLEAPPMIGALGVPSCDYNMFYNVFEQVPKVQRDLISQAWEKFGYLHIPSFGYGDIYSLIFPRIVVGTTPEQVTYDPSITGLHALPICSCPSYQYGNKKWIDRTRDRQRYGGCKHIFFALDILRIPHGYFKWEEKNQEKVDQIVAMTTADL